MFLQNFVDQVRIWIKFKLNNFLSILWRVPVVSKRNPVCSFTCGKFVLGILLEFVRHVIFFFFLYVNILIWMYEEDEIQHESILIVNLR